MKLIEGKREWMDVALDTPLDAICVKRRGKGLKELCDDPHGHGILVSPYVARGPAATAMMDQAIESAKSRELTVTVRGHGWGGETLFVWTGSADEFNATWVID